MVMIVVIAFVHSKIMFICFEFSFPVPFISDFTMRKTATQMQVVLITFIFS